MTERLRSGTLDDARTRSVRLPDAYLWIEAYALDALCSVAIAARHENVRKWIGDLESLAGRTGMREFVARAYLHRARLGDRRRWTSPRSSPLTCRTQACGMRSRPNTR